MNYASKLGEVARASLIEAHEKAHRHIDEIMRAAMLKHYGDRYEDHVSEVTLEVQPGYSSVPRFTGDTSEAVMYRRLRRNLDGKLLVEIKVTTCRFNIRVEGEIFE